VELNEGEPRPPEEEKKIFSSSFERGKGRNSHRKRSRNFFRSGTAKKNKRRRGKRGPEKGKRVFFERGRPSFSLREKSSLREISEDWAVQTVLASEKRIVEGGGGERKELSQKETREGEKPPKREEENWVGKKKKRTIFSIMEGGREVTWK